MNDTLRSWIIGLAGTGLLTAAANALTPKGKVKNVVKLICGIAMALALITPVVEFDFTALSGSLAKYSARSDNLESAIFETNDRLTGFIIEGRCAAYILDKAQVFGLEAIDVSVTVKRGDEGTWYPYEAVLEILGTESYKNRLRNCIESDLGIPAVRQYWRNSNEEG